MIENKPDEKTFTQIREEISDEELTSFANVIKQRYGVDFTQYESKSLKRGVARLISKNGYNSLLDLWTKLLKDRNFFFECVDELLVNLTEMFRNAEIWVKIKNDLLEKIRNKGIIKIWHAGCSTGEEIYTMTIVLKEANLFFKSQLYATDLSNQALEKAKQGEYNNLLWNKYKTSYLKYNKTGRFENYFETTNDNFKIKDEFKKAVTFAQQNLAQDVVVKKFNIIFCRNVMIYFDDALKMKVLKKYCDALEPDGFFVIGFYDMLPEQSKELFTLYDADNRIYVKNPSKK